MVGAGAGLFFLAGRFFALSWFASMGDTVFLSLAVTAEALPISAGAILFGARVAKRPMKAAEAISEIEEVMEKLESFRSWLDESRRQPLPEAMKARARCCARSTSVFEFGNQRDVRVIRFPDVEIRA